MIICILIIYWKLYTVKEFTTKFVFLRQNFFYRIGFRWQGCHLSPNHYLKGQNAKLSFLLLGVELSVDGDTVLDAVNSGQTFFQSLCPEHLRERRVSSFLLHEDCDVIIG